MGPAAERRTASRDGGRVGAEVRALTATSPPSAGDAREPVQRGTADSVAGNTRAWPVVPGFPEGFDSGSSGLHGCCCRSDRLHSDPSRQGDIHGDGARGPRIRGDCQACKGKGLRCKCDL